VNKFFIIGNPRSGTSLLRLMLTCHSEIMIPPECAFLVWWYEKYKNWNDENQDELLESFIKDLAQSKKIEFWELDFVLLKEYLSQRNISDYASLSDMVYSFYIEMKSSSKVKYWGDKNNYYVKHIDLLNQLFPDAKFIQIIRDGRDVASSYKNMGQIKSDSKYAPNLPSEISEIAAEWAGNNEMIYTSFQKEGLIDKTITVRYEDLVMHPEKSLKRLCDFLLIEFEDGMLNYHSENRNSFLEPKDFLAWKQKTFQKIDSKAVGKYKTHFSKSEIESFEQIAKSTLEKYNYL